MMHPIPYSNPWSLCPSLGMASHTQLNNAMSIDKLNYETQRAKTEVKTRLKEGQMPKEMFRSSQWCLKKLLTFAEDPTKAASAAEISREVSDHEDWIDGVEVILT